LSILAWIVTARIFDFTKLTSMTWWTLANKTIAITLTLTTILAWIVTAVIFGFTQLTCETCWTLANETIAIR